MEGKMKVAVMQGIGKMGFEERDIPKVKENEVSVEVICIIMKQEQSEIML